MKQTKRVNFKMLLIAVLALIMAFALVACNGDKKNNDDKSSDEVSDTELYVGTGGIWDYMTKEDLEFVYGFLYTEVQREPNTGGYCFIVNYVESHSDGNDIYPIGSCNGAIISVMTTNSYGFGCLIFSSHENAAKFVQESEQDNDSEFTYILRNNNMVFYIDSNFPRIDNVRAGNYNLNNLPAKQMKMINSMFMKHNVEQITLGWGNEVQNKNAPNAPKGPMSGIEGVVRYYDSACSRCLISETMIYYTGDGANEYIDGIKQEFEQKCNDQIGVEYTEDSGIEVNKEEGYVHSKLKTKPGFRFESEAEGEASVTDYYYDSEEDLDAVIPSTTPDGKTVTKLSGHYYEEIKSVTIPVSVNSISYGAFTSCKDLQAIYYCGNEEQWNEINIGSGNDALVNAKRYYFSEQPNYDGKHWHWNAQHKPEVWAN